MTYHYRVHGLRVRSAFELSELSLDASPGEPDVVIRQGPVPHDLWPCRFSNDGYMVAESDILFAMPRVGRFLARGGTELIAEPEPNVDLGLFALYLLGSALAAILHQRGHFPIHASAFAHDGKCIGFMGDSGAGKSTLAAMLAARGFRLVSEDVLVVRFDDRQRPVVETGIPILKLWPDSIARAALPGLPASAESNSDNKQRLAATCHYGARALPLARLYQLRWLHPATASTEIRPLSPFEAVFALRRNVYRNGLIAAMDREQEFLAFASRLVRAVPLSAFHRPMNFATATEQIDYLVADLTAT